MKRLIQGLSFLLVMLVAIVGASAVNLESSNQLASNYNEGITRLAVERTLSIPTTNHTGSVTCEVRPVSPYTNTALSGVRVSQDYFINLTINGQRTVSVNIDENETIELRVNGRIPGSLPAVDTNFNVISPRVATVDCDVGSETISRDVTMSRENRLEIIRVEASFGDNFAAITRDRGVIRNILPGDLMNLELRVRNNIPRADNIEMDVLGNLNCDSADIFVDKNEDDIILISAETGELMFELEFEEDFVRGTTYTCDVSATATDDYGARFGAIWDLRFEVERENFDVRIEQVQLSPSTLTCTARQVNANINIKNIGDRSDNRIAIELEIPALGITETVTNLDIDSTSQARRPISFRISEDAQHGTHEVIVRAYSRTSVLRDTYTTSITLPDCRPESERERDEPEPSDTEAELQRQIEQLLQQQQALQQELQQQQEQPSPVQNVTVEDDETETTAREMNGVYTVLLVLLILVLIAGIVGLLVYLFKE